MFQVLSIDGGGIRGLFAAAVLAAMEEDLETKITEHFDLIAGTSTGGIIAIALGLGLSPAEIVHFYLDHGPTIFENRYCVRSLWQWLRPKYSAGPLIESLRAAFGERTFGESTKRLVVPAYNLTDDDVYIFRTPHHARLRRDYRVPAWKVALATTAAPTYFPACRSVDELRLIDGGVWANNPSMVALVECTGTLDVSADQIKMLSIGTFEHVTRRSRRLDRGGRLAWAPDAAAVMLHASSIGVANHVRFVLTEQRFLRINPSVPAAEVALDRVRNTGDLIARARHHSRILMPAFAEMFLGHRSQAYSPIYRVE